MPYCKSCEQDRPASEFQADYSRILKVMSVCRNCNRYGRRIRRKKAKQREVLKALGYKV